MFSRALKLPPAGSETFFLWGPRQTGKSTLLKSAYPHALWIDLLKADEYRKHLQNPERLRLEVEGQNPTPFIVIDEIQKVPALLDEVHWLHENRAARFALCGSSARKVKRGQANLLGGRAVRYELRGLCARELGGDFDLDRMINNGYLPNIYLSGNPAGLLASYVGDYLKEEIAAEGAARNLPAFSEFLWSSALSDCEIVNFTNIARECGISAPTVKGYFDILTDTLLGSWLPSFTKRPKRRVIQAPKFYFSDVGIVNHLTKRGGLEQGSELYGKAFENYIHHELRCHEIYSGPDRRLSYWRLASGLEVDFIIGDMSAAIEAKAVRRVTPDHLKGLRQLVLDYPETRSRHLVCLETRRMKTEDGIEILPLEDFLHDLRSGVFQ
jgi:predicted AAA+ superfamily ATPase